MGACMSSDTKTTEQKANTEKPVAQTKAAESTETSPVVVAEDKKVEEAAAQPKQPTEPKTEKPVETKEEPKAEEAAPAAAVVATPEAEETKTEEPKAEEKPAEEAVATEDASALPGVVTPEEHQALLEEGKDWMKKGHAANAKANELHDAASAIKETDKDGYHAKVEESKPFRAEAKECFAKSIECQKKVGISMAIKAQHSDTPSIDLHGFFLEQAMQAVYDAFEHLAKRTTGAKEFLIITGAGNHSDPKVGVKIKPAVVEYLTKENYQFEAANNGSYTVQLKD